MKRRITAAAVALAAAGLVIGCAPSTPKRRSQQARADQQGQTQQVQQVQLQQNQPATNQVPQPVTPSNKVQAQPTGPALAFEPTDRIQLSATRELAIQKIETLAQHENAQVRANAVEAAGLIASRAKPLIAAGLKDKNAGVRSVAAMTIGKHQITDLAAEVSPLLTDPTPEVRAAAIYALARTNYDADRTPLASMLLEDQSPWVRRQAAFILGELGDKSALQLLRTGANDPFRTASPEQYKNLQLQIAEAMIKLGDNKSRQVIRAALYPARPEELEAAALAVQIIGDIRDREATDQLISMSAYRDSAGQMYPGEIRLGIAGALAKLNMPRGGFIADEFATSKTDALRTQAAHVYGLVGGNESIAKLRTMMDDPYPLVQAAAAAGVLRAGSR